MSANKGNVSFPWALAGENLYSSPVNDRFIPGRFHLTTTAATKRHYCIVDQEREPKCWILLFRGGGEESTLNLKISTGARRSGGAGIWTCGVVRSHSCWKWVSLLWWQWQGGQWSSFSLQGVFSISKPHTSMILFPQILPDQPKSSLEDCHT